MSPSGRGSAQCGARRREGAWGSGLDSVWPARKAAGGRLARRLPLDSPLRRCFNTPAEFLDDQRAWKGTTMATVTVCNYKKFDITQSKDIIPRRMATRKYIAKIDGSEVRGSAVEI